MTIALEKTITLDQGGSMVDAYCVLLCVTTYNIDKASLVFCIHESAATYASNPETYHVKTFDCYDATDFAEYFKEHATKDHRERGYDYTLAKIPDFANAVVVT